MLEGSSMPRKFPKPFFRTGRGWYVQLGTVQIKLADGPEDSETQAAALRRYHEVLAERGREVHPDARQPDQLTVAEVLDNFLTWCKTHRAHRTYEWYHDHIQSFINHSPGVARLPASELKPFHVVTWSDSHGEAWSNAYRRGAIIAIQRPFNWASQLGYLSSSPVSRIPKPQAQRREQFVTPEEWVRIRDHYEDGNPFRDLLEFAWETGLRPEEAKKIEPRHVELGRHRVAFPPKESKGKKRWRIVLMTERAEAIVTRLLAECPGTFLFRNENGKPWTSMAMACRFGRLKKKLGVKYAAYSIRHGFCQRMLENGVDHLTVAALMGHANGRMVAETYSHMNRADDHLQNALTKASSNG
jgi:integrase/recombinase XerC